MKVIYFRLAFKMTERGISQKDLAKIMHMTNSALNRRMTGKVLWSVSEIRELCRIFDCTFEELFGE